MTEKNALECFFFFLHFNLMFLQNKRYIPFIFDKVKIENCHFHFWPQWKKAAIDIKKLRPGHLTGGLLLDNRSAPYVCVEAA